MTDPIEIVRGRAELLDQVKPLWLALRAHHHQIAPDLGPVREDADSWRRRRAQYEQWLTDQRAFVLVATRLHVPVAYAFARVQDRVSPTWAQSDPALELETLSVLPAARGTGVGSRLIALVREEVDRGGYAGLFLTAVATNHDALRFYEREGFVPTFVTLRDTRRRP